jgi:hypothetical protein
MHFRLLNTPSIDKTKMCSKATPPPQPQVNPTPLPDDIAPITPLPSPTIPVPSNPPSQTTAKMSQEHLERCQSAARKCSNVAQLLPPPDIKEHGNNISLSWPSQQLRIQSSVRAAYMLPPHMEDYEMFARLRQDVDQSRTALYLESQLRMNAEKQRAVLFQSAQTLHNDLTAKLHTLQMAYDNLTATNNSSRVAFNNVSATAQRYQEDITRLITENRILRAKVILHRIGVLLSLIGNSYIALHLSHWTSQPRKIDRFVSYGSEFPISFKTATV